jgi:hypothetical protein
MPYDPENPPDKLKNLSENKQRQWVHVFNSCFEKNGDEGMCHQMAWGVVNKKESAAMKPWSPRFISPDFAKAIGEKRRDTREQYNYVPFGQLSPSDRSLARRSYPYKHVGAKYDFADEHYYYPVDEYGELVSGRRCLAIPLKMINDDAAMADLGYTINPEWKGRAAGVTQRDATKIAFGIAFAGQDKMTPDEVGLVCPACAKSMRAKNIKWVRTAVVRDSLFQ